MHPRSLTVAALLTLSLCASPLSAMQKDPRKNVLTGTMMKLWEGDAPGAAGKEDKDTPALFLYPAAKEKATGAGIVVCPGGGYGGLAVDHEGEQVAEWLNSIGVNAYVLRYRLGSAGYRHPVMMNDVNRAVRTVRAKAAEWGNDPARIGVLGFSAGGHLASTAVTHWDDGKPDAQDPIEKVSSRPDWGVLIYPVITMTAPFTHGGSRKNLLGENPAPELVDLMSNEKQVTDKTPPCFLVHAEDDKVVPPENSLMLIAALTKHKVPFAVTFFDHGGHGFGLGTKDPALAVWPAQCAEWMKGRGFLTTAK
jgi:acetyl esterase/lipase